MTYWDTSALAPLYVAEARSAAVNALAAGTDATLAVTPLQELELANAVELRLFRGELNMAEARAAWQAYQRDCDAGVLVRRHLPDDLFPRALFLAQTYSAGLGTRSLDVLHVALALELGASSFLSFDDRQRRLAQAAGLKLVA